MSPRRRRDVTAAGTVTVDELVVRGWSRRRADRFAVALTAALPEALARASGPGGGDDRPPGRAADVAADLHVTLDAAQRRDPVRAAEAVAAALAARVAEVGP